MKQIDLSSHSYSHIVILIDLVPSPHKTLCSTYEPTWHFESCLKCLFLPLQQDNTLNRWEKNDLESWLKFATRRPHNAIRSMYEDSWHVESFFEIYPPWTQPSNIYILAPTKHYIQHRSAWTNHLEPCLTSNSSMNKQTSWGDGQAARTQSPPTSILVGGLCLARRSTGACLDFTLADDWINQLLMIELPSRLASWPWPPSNWSRSTSWVII